MAITVKAEPVTLTWRNFTVVAEKILDPSDNTLQEAHTTFGFDLPNKPLRKVDGQMALAETNVLRIFPRARIWRGARQTDALLSHEQLHYDVGIVTSRALAEDLMKLRAPNARELEKLFLAAFKLHHDTRAAALQKRYDLDTHHGTNATSQTWWKDKMAACLADATSLKLADLDL